MSGNATRRQALAQLGGLGALAAGLGTVADLGSPAAALASAAAPTLAGPAALGLRHYISAPGLTPPAIAVTSAKHAPAGPEYFFLTAPGSGPGPGGGMIIDRFGDLVWFSPSTATKAKFNLNRQTFQGKPVLTWWDGLVTGGHGDGVAVIADSSYKTLHTIRAGNGLTIDLHEFVITKKNTALVTCYRHATNVDLTSIGGPAAGDVLSGVVQEIDIASGDVLFTWDSLDHIDLTETESTFSGGTAGEPFDYFHINSIQETGNGDLLISARNTWALYRIARSTGDVRWRLGGKKSDFKMGTGTAFHWQHHARLHSGGLLSLFDDAAAPAEEKQSRGLILKVDTTARTVAVHKQYARKPSVLAQAMGSMQVMNTGRVLVGWGTVPRFTEFSPGGEVLVDAQIATGSPSYRTVRSDWTGKPSGHPAIAVRHHNGGARVYASWNGATEIHRWRILAGRTAAHLSWAGAADKKSFETMVPTTHRGPHYRAVALDKHGHVLGRSPIVRLK